MSYRVTVGDRLEALATTFKQRARQADVVIVNGGLGPTSDDLSAAAAALALGEDLVEHSDWHEALKAKFARMDRIMDPANLKQAMLPRSAEILDNPIGTACGFAIELDGAAFFFTPGVPSEMKRMVREQIFPSLEKRFGLAPASWLQRLHCFGVSESRLGRLLDEIVLDPQVTLGFRAHLPTIEIKIMGKGADGAEVRDHMQATAREIRDRIGENIIAEGDHGIAGYLQDLMVAGGHTLALAESCTGGMAASDLVEMPGSSAYFDRSFVTYSNRAKTEMLGVPPQLIETHGAVSLETAREMARGARLRAAVSHALAISGVAGPDGGTEDKPVGTVAFALATPQHLFSQVLRTPKWGRSHIRRIAAAAALDMLRRHLTGQPVFGNYDLSKRIREEQIAI